MDLANMLKSIDLCLDEAEELNRMLSRVKDDDDVGAGVVLIASSRDWQLWSPLSFDVDSNIFINS